MSRVKDKIKDIEDYLEELKEIVPNELSEYESDNVKKAACERYFEKIVEAMVDLSFMVIKLRNIDIPEDDINAIDMLEKNKIITTIISDKLKDAKRMRNIIIHAYGKVDDSLVYNAVKNELNKDIKKFLQEVKKCL